MESANLHFQHQLQEQYAGCSSLATKSGHKVSATHDWNPYINLNGTYNTFNAEYIPNSKELWPKDVIVNDPPDRTSMSQINFGLCDERSFTQQSPSELFLPKSEEMPKSFPKLSDTMFSLSSVEESHLPPPSKHDQQQCSDRDVGEDLWLISNFSSGCQITGPRPSAGGFYSNADQNPARFEDMATSIRFNYSHVFPSTNSSNLDMSSSLVSSSLGFNLQALDLSTPTNYGGSSSQSSLDNLGLYEESMSLGHDRMQELRNSPSKSSDKTIAFLDGATRKKRSSNFFEVKESRAETKKSRIVSRSLCPPLKVRKEKLGDRIAALQRLVAPYGKTDTASVLTEAIGYIQFLHDQVQTLSVPYMKLSQSKPPRTMQAGSKDKDGKEEAKRDLKSRGLCLVPLSCASYMNNYNAGIWSPP